MTSSETVCSDPTGGLWLGTNKGLARIEGLRATGRRVRRPDATIAVADHNVPTTDRSKKIEDWLVDVKAAKK